MKTTEGNITKAFMNGRSQAVRIPKEYRFPDEDLFVNKVGDSLVITPKSALKETFEKGLKMFSQDFMVEEDEEKG